MLIHSVTHPLMLSERQNYPETAFKSFEGGYLEGFDTPQGFQLSRLHSTDLSMYLKNEYSPGSVRKTGKV